MAKKKGIQSNSVAVFLIKKIASRFIKFKFVKLYQELVSSNIFCWSYAVAHVDRTEVKILKTLYIYIIFWDKVAKTQIETHK